MLEKARNYETEKQVYVKKTTKPLFHVTAPTGWINDPNGFSVYDGKIHLFYQYNPYQREWGPMHWGHSVTDDMVRWAQLPAAIAPELTRQTSIPRFLKLQSSRTRCSNFVKFKHPVSS